MLELAALVQLTQAWLEQVRSHFSQISLGIVLC